MKNRQFLSIFLICVLSILIISATQKWLSALSLHRLYAASSKPTILRYVWSCPPKNTSITSCVLINASIKPCSLLDAAKARRLNGRLLFECTRLYHCRYEEESCRKCYLCCLSFTTLWYPPAQHTRSSLIFIGLMEENYFIYFVICVAYA